MTRPLRIGVLGLTHDHVWDHLPDVRSNPDTRLVAVADPHQALLGRAEARIPLPAVQQSGNHARQRGTRRGLYLRGQRRRS